MLKSLKNGCPNNWCTLGLNSGSTYKHKFKKSFPYSDISIGIFGLILVSLINFIILLGHFPLSDHGGRPVSSSIVRQPKLHISALREYPSYLTTSGAIQYGDPFREWHNSSSSFPCSPLEVKSFEAPKSLSFTCPSPESSTLAHLISLWITPIEWR